MTLRLDPDSGWLDDVRRCPSPNHDQRPQGTEVDVLVIHAISLPPGRFGGDFIEQLFTNRLDPDAHPYFADIHQLRVSAHFLVRRDGELLQFVPTTRRAWHAGESLFQGRPRANDYAIGIELEGCDEQPFESAQYDVLRQLTRAIQAVYPAIDRGRIVGHSDIAPGRKTDPGPLFDWDRYLNA